MDSYSPAIQLELGLNVWRLRNFFSLCLNRARESYSTKYQCSESSRRQEQSISLMMSVMFIMSISIEYCWCMCHYYYNVMWVLLMYVMKCERCWCIKAEASHCVISCLRWWHLEWPSLCLHSNHSSSIKCRSFSHLMLVQTSHVQIQHNLLTTFHGSASE